MIYEFERHICNVKQPGIVTVTADSREDAIEKAYLAVGLHPEHYNRPDTEFTLLNTETE